MLTVAQIRYCLAESIRIDGADPGVDSYSSREVDHFNELVDDYNRRCGEYRYYEGTLMRARRDVERYRSELLAEGKARFLRSVGRSSSRPSAVPDTLVREAQQLLNSIGYDAGPADGFAGPRTRDAVIAFQKDRDLSVDGQIDGGLVLLLRIVAIYR